MQPTVSFRIKNARLQHGLSLQQVADALKISKQMVSKYEQGNMPGSDKLIALANLFNTRVDYFFREPEINLGEINFRKRSRLSTKKINALKEEVRFQIENYLLIEELCNLDTEFENPIASLPITSKEDVLKAVEKLRLAWDIGHDPIRSIIELLEDKEVKVIEIHDDSELFDGLATVIDSKYYVIVINQNMPLERKRFTLLHELGHLLLNIPNAVEKETEQYCNWFASEMLLGAENMIMEFGEKRNSISLEELKHVQAKYGISIKAIVYKLGDTGIISQAKLTQFYKTVNANRDIKAEVDQSRFNGKEGSSRFQHLVYRALFEETITLSKASALLKISIDSLRGNLSSINIR